MEMEELHSPLAKRWLEEIEKYLPKKALSPEKKIEDESKERKESKISLGRIEKWWSIQKIIFGGSRVSVDIRCSKRDV